MGNLKNDEKIHENPSLENHNKFHAEEVKIPGVSVGWLEEYFLQVS